VSKDKIVIAPGQTRPVPFLLTLKSDVISSDIAVAYSEGDEEAVWLTAPVQMKSKRSSLSSTHKVTHLHPGGVVSYAMLRPPAFNATCGTAAKAPIFLFFHGAGVEADNGIVSHALDAVPELCAWAVFPTGVTPWSSDDWRESSYSFLDLPVLTLLDTWGFVDVEAAVSSVHDWIERFCWKGIAVAAAKWFVSGHSNGGSSDP
jgi:hypothetical protein